MAEVVVKSRSVDRVVALVDDTDLVLVESFSWHMAGGKGSTGKYAATNVRLHGKPVTHYMHRMVAWAMGLILSPVGTEGPRWTLSVDHINGDKLDNRRENLRLLDRPSQMRNPNDGLRSTNRSGHRGVAFVASRERYGKPWMAHVMVDGKAINLGWFASVDEIGRAHV